MIINHLKSSNKINRKTIEEILNLSKSGARKVIDEMIENNLIISAGKGKNVYYTLKH